MGAEATVNCTKCGCEIQADSAESLCPACLLELAFEDETEGGKDEPVVHSRAGSVLGDYRLLEELGQGGMGQVFLADHVPTSRRVALKLLSRKLESHELRQRFFREGRLAASINHPNSLYVYGSQEIDGIPVIAMEVAHAGTLQDRLYEKGRLPVPEAVDAMLDIIDGLEAAHEKGVLHRDVKPSNCFLDADGSVKVGDYGLSFSPYSSEDAFEPHREHVLGTPAYASPEQLQGHPLDVRADIYSVGSTLFHLLTGEVPFDGEDVEDMVANVLKKPPKSLGRLCPASAPDLEQVVVRCLSKQPDRRFSNYRSLRNALLPFSSRALEQATVLQRLAAGWIDYLIALFPAYVILMLTVGGSALVVRPLVEPSFFNARYYLLLAVIGLAYFTVFEWRWGAGLGKHLWGLVVADSSEQRRPTLLQAFIRAAVALGSVEAVRMPLLIVLISDARWSAVQSVTFVLVTILCGSIPPLLALWSKSPATFWDRLSRTRVYKRPEGINRPSLSPAVMWKSDAESRNRMGPYACVDTIVRGDWLVGFDPVLRRHVWLFNCSSEEVARNRRLLSRPGRTKWLQQVQADGTTWDVFSAPDGAPLSQAMQLPGANQWACLRHVLYDLAFELGEAEGDGSLPDELSLDQIWITSQWRALLLERPWPSVETEAARFRMDTPAGWLAFLSAIAGHLDRSTLPVHARELIRNIRDKKFEQINQLAVRLRSLLARPVVVDRSLRLASETLLPAYILLAVLAGHFHDKPIAYLREAFVPITLASVGGYAAVQLLVMAGFRTAIGPTLFNLAIVPLDDSRISRGKLLFRLALTWGTLFLPLLPGGLLFTGRLFNPAALAWLLVWFVGVALTLFRKPPNWMDRLTQSFLVRQ